jgi:hypothetical protein
VNRVAAGIRKAIKQSRKSDYTWFRENGGNRILYYKSQKSFKEPAEIDGVNAASLLEPLDQVLGASDQCRNFEEAVSQRLKALVESADEEARREAAEASVLLRAIMALFEAGAVSPDVPPVAPDEPAAGSDLSVDDNVKHVSPDVPSAAPDEPASPDVPSAAPVEHVSSDTPPLVPVEQSSALPDASNVAGAELPAAQSGGAVSPAASQAVPVEPVSPAGANVGASPALVPW